MAELLNERSETDDPTSAWSVYENSTGAVRVTAVTTGSWPTREPAYAAAEELLAAVLALGFSLRMGADSDVGAVGPDDKDATWRGRIDVVLEEPSSLSNG